MNPQPAQASTPNGYIYPATVGRKNVVPQTVRVLTPVAKVPFRVLIAAIAQTYAARHVAYGNNGSPRGEKVDNSWRRIRRQWHQRAAHPAAAHRTHYLVASRPWGMPWRVVLGQVLALLRLEGLGLACSELARPRRFGAATRTRSRFAAARIGGGGYRHRRCDVRYSPGDLCAQHGRSGHPEICRQESAFGTGADHSGAAPRMLTSPDRAGLRSCEPVGTTAIGTGETVVLHGRNRGRGRPLPPLVGAPVGRRRA